MLLIRLWLSLVPNTFRGTGIQLMIVTKICHLIILLKLLLANSSGDQASKTLYYVLIQSIVFQF